MYNFTIWCTLFCFVFVFSGENATLSCKIGSVPSSKVQWYRDGTEILNNSLVNRGQQQFVIQETGGFEKTSTLVLTQARPEDSGPFMCVSQNQAGRVEANFTLQVCCCSCCCCEILYYMYIFIYVHSLLTSISIFTVWWAILNHKGAKNKTNFDRYLQDFS